MQILQSQSSVALFHAKDQWVTMKSHDHDGSSVSNGSTTSSSSSMVDDDDDVFSSSSSSSNGALYQLSELMTHLPIKRGLSNYFQGKSQSFTSFTSVRSIEDLAKKENPYTKRMKTCKSHENGFDTHKSYTHDLPKATISKKVSRSLKGRSRGNNFVFNSKKYPNPISVPKEP
ncbi:Oxidative stress 3 putative isoform 2 [Tripterygium wilfordii]|uniref:Oxidative stress 3 putative isoform 2 n=1 Tax=Tripterygium wilfordii TaxID=458696 RepID=A0A7J7CYU8_TRIWF|nr:uncharacterized protein LOC120010171 [Tripterygium wilfordii]KAF5739188.1 Oxidative stress 3 putative isoform 2 [Tripterygium wilfordii]